MRKPKNASNYTRKDKLLTVFNFGLDFLFPLLLIYLSFFKPHLNPLYFFVQHYPIPVKVFVQIMSCLLCNTLVSVSVLCLLAVIHGIFITYVAINNLNSSIGVNYVQKRFRFGIGFKTGIKIYQNLRILTIIESELARDLMVPCLHHFHLVIFSTIALYYFILQFFQRGKIFHIIVTLSLAMLLLGGIVEFFAVCYTAKASILSNEFISKVLKLYGHVKIKRAMTAGLQPVSINLEVFRSVETIENGVGMSYFLRYLERIGYHTVSLLLAGK